MFRHLGEPLRSVLRPRELPVLAVVGAPMGSSDYNRRNELKPN